MKHLTVDQTTVNRDLRDRVRNLERGTPGGDRPLEEEVVEWSQKGTAVAAVSVPKRVRRGGQVVAFNIDAGTAATSGSSTFRVRQNGSVIGSTITLAQGDTSVTGYIGDYRVPRGALLTTESVTVGTGLAKVTAQVVMKG